MIIIDSSIVISHTMPDENDNYADRILRELARDRFQAVVPAIFYLECTNVFLMAERNKRINRSDRIKYLNLIQELPVDVDHVASNGEGVKYIASIAAKADLTSYDAAYLELATRKNSHLATLHKKLSRAADQLGLLLRI